MIYHLSLSYVPWFSSLNVIHYTSFRAITALLSSLFCAFLCGNWFIRKSQKFFRAKARDWTPENHKAKDGMPTMGGLFMVSIVIINTFLWCNLNSFEVWIFLLCLVGFAIIGFLDDFF